MNDLYFEKLRSYYLDTKLEEDNTDKIDEDRLINLLDSILTDEQKSEVIKTKLYLDLDKLEDMVYNRVIDADVVDGCIIRNKPTVRLNIKKRKDEENNG